MESIKDPSSKLSPTTSHQGSRALPLACRECQRKKTRCDRTYPCTPCTRAGIPCVPSTRKPRARTGAKAVDAELRSRIAKLERLVESFKGEEANSPTHPDDDQSPAHEEVPPAARTPISEGANSPPAKSPNTSKYLAGSFWSSLTAEVSALREVFEEDGAGSDEEAVSSEQTPSSHGQPLDFTSGGVDRYELMLCPPGSLYVVPGAIKELEGPIVQMLWMDFLQHIEPVTKLLHVPTLRLFMERGEPLYGRDADAVCNQALRAAIFFAAAVSIPEVECQRYFGKTRDQVSADFLRHVDVALYAADPLNTTELATLQAMVLYVSSLRVLDNSRRAWSLLGLIVRIARAMNLHREASGETVYMAELRRRLWHNLVFLDCYSSLDRGSEPAITPDSWTRLLPTHCNDDDFGVETTTLAAREGELTDMSLALMTQDGSDLVLRLSLPEHSINTENWQYRLELAYSYQRKIQSRYLRFCDPSKPFEKMIIGIGWAASHSMILRAVRPMQYNISSVPPRVDSPWILQLAVNILQHCDSMWMQADLGGWRRLPWVPWHAIVVALAGLCSIRGTPLANEAWILVDRSMVYYAASVADSRNGLLWKPIEKLRKKAVAFRDQLPVETKSAQSSPPTSSPSTVGTNVPGVAQFNNFIPMPSSGELDGVIHKSFDPTIPLQDTAFNFPPEMLASLPPADTSWFDWETIMKDIGDVTYDGMQLT